MPYLKRYALMEVYNNIRMPNNQRTTTLFTRTTSQGKSLNIESHFLTPKYRRILPQPTPLPHHNSTSKYHHPSQHRIHSIHSEHHEEETPLRKLISLKLVNEFSPNGHKKGKEEELRETDDSVKPKSHKRSLTINSFNIIKQLGRGKHGTVFLAMHKQTGFLGALKVFNKQQLRGENQAEGSKLQEELIREFKIQSFISHQHIIKLYSIFADKDFVYAFMELGSDGQLYDVFQKRRRFKEETISFVIRALLEAFGYLHGKGIIHRDIKPQNIVLIHGFPKICDFGQSNFFSKEKGELRQTLCGTPLYLSPQILIGDKYDEKIDIWALGAMAYELFTAMNPFNIKNKDQIKRIITQEFKMSEGSIEICNFLTHCLKKHPLQRPTSAKLLKHPFIAKWKQLETAEELCSSSNV